MSRCTRPDCDRQAFHRPHIDGKQLDGWERLCCHHVDVFMATTALTVPADEAALGWEAWMARHEDSCGALF